MKIERKYHYNKIVFGKKVFRGPALVPSGSSCLYITQMIHEQKVPVVAHRLVILSAYPERVKANRDWWKPWKHTVFIPIATGVREAHHELAMRAIDEGWDENVKVLQDDVEPFVFPDHYGEVTSYAGHVDGHACPRAFSATPQGWIELERAWSVDGKTCLLWKPNRIYNTVTHHAKSAGQ